MTSDRSTPTRKKPAHDVKVEWQRGVAMKMAAIRPVKLLLGGAVAIGLAAIGQASAEPVTDRILAGHQVMTKGGCTLVKINFNIRIRYVSHFPLDGGQELRITVRPIDPAQAATDVLTRRESLRPPDARVAPIKAIEFEAARADGPTLTIQFLRPVAYQVGPGADFESIVVTIADPKSGKARKPEYPIGAGSAWNATVMRQDSWRPLEQQQSREAGPPVAAPSRNKDRPSGQISAADLKTAAATMDGARAALRSRITRRRSGC